MNVRAEFLRLRRRTGLAALLGVHLKRRVWLWLSVLAVGCPSPETRAPTSPQPVSGSEPCRELARAYCKLMDECQPEAMHSELGSEADCVTRWSDACARASTLRGSGFSDDKVRACAAGIGAHTCGTLRRFDDLVISACHPSGELANGASCLDDAQCKSTFCSRSVDPGGLACGVCAPRAPSQGRCWNGMPDSPRGGCQVGEVCSRGYCLGPMRNEGEACGAAGAWTSDCYGDHPVERFPYGLGCGEPRTDPRFSGTCTRYQPVKQCPQGFECDQTDFCDRGSCKPKRLVGPRESCDEKSDLCLAGTCKAGACVPLPAAGDACGEDVECSFPFMCVKGACALTNPTCGT